MKKKIIISSTIAVALIVVVLAIRNQRNKAEAARKSNEEFINKLKIQRQSEDRRFENLKDY
jgi:hypothetical protein